MQQTAAAAAAAEREMKLRQKSRCCRIRPWKLDILHCWTGNYLGYISLVSANMNFFVFVVWTLTRQLAALDDSAQQGLLAELVFR
jgi:hypothetical protein